MKIILGTAQLGLDYGFTNNSGKPKLNKSLEIIKYALDNNINTFDTARAYGDSENILGLANKNKNLNIITKLDLLDNFDKLESENDKYKIIDNSINTSLNNLNISIIDTLLLHRFKHYNNKFIWNYLLKNKKLNKIKKLGVSIYNINEAILALKDDNIKHIQLPINILDNQWFNDDFLDLVNKRTDVVIHVRSILLQGILVSSDEKWPKIDGVNPKDYIDKLNNLVKKFNLNNRIELCFSYIKSIKWINGLVIGVDNIEQLSQNIKLFDTRILNQDDIKYIRNIFANTPKELLDPLFWSV